MPVKSWKGLGKLEQMDNVTVREKGPSSTIETIGIISEKWLFPGMVDLCLPPQR